MSLQTQKYLRLIIPGIFLYGLLVVFCWTTQWCTLAIPQTWEELSKLLAAVVLGALYNFTHLRELSNKFYHFDVNSNIVRILTRPFITEMPGVQRIAWQDFRSTFYNVVDHDESLKVKSEIIRFNGLLWTSVADLRVVTIIAVLIFSASMICSAYITPLRYPEYRAGIPIFLLSIIFLCTFWFSKITTDRHKVLGMEQCEYILEHHRDALKGKLEQICARLESGS
jgi:hypothetical protein